MSMDLNNSPKDAKKKRRLSSPFHRSSRSRSRPSSIALPRNTPYDLSTATTPRNTPPRETPPVAGSGSGSGSGSWGGSRPHSFHAPDAWNVVPSGRSRPISTPPLEEANEPAPVGRLGVLPSPAKSAFSVGAQDREGNEDIPPMPPLPDVNQESHTNDILRSVVRYSTPPVMDVGVLGLRKSAVVEEEEDACGGAEKDTAIPLIEQDSGEVKKHVDEDDQVKHDSVSSAVKESRQVGASDEEPPNSEPGGIEVQSPAGQVEKNSYDNRYDNDHLPTLHHDPIPIVTTASDISPLLAAVDFGRSDGEENKRRPRLHVDSSVAGGEISPMMAPIRLDGTNARASLGAGGARDGSIHTTTHTDARHTRFKYETELIGAGDVSPISISRHALDTDNSTPTKDSRDDSMDGAGDEHEHGHEHKHEHESETPATASTARQTEYFAKAVDKDFTSSSSSSLGPSQVVAEGPVSGSSSIAPTSSQDSDSDQQDNGQHQHRNKDKDKQREENVRALETGARPAQLITAPAPAPSSSKPPLLAQQPQPQQRQHQLSASPYQVVHAVAIEYVPSTSSFETWDQDSILAPSHSAEGSQLGDLFDLDDSDLPPVPLIPDAPVPSHDHEHGGPITLDPGRDSTTTTRRGTANRLPSVNCNSIDDSHPNTSNTSHPAALQDTRPPSPMALAAVARKAEEPQRSHSLLSAISSGVSAKSAPISPTSSLARSRPSGKGRSKYSPARVDPGPAQIVEEPAQANSKPIVATNTDDYDLYADHDGIVKDVQDERGQPLRLANVHITNASPTTKDPVPGHPNPTPPNALQDDDDEVPRYSTERPMSFISGPRDANGRPQDQINRPSVVSDDPVPPVPTVPSLIREQHPVQPDGHPPQQQSQGPPQPNGLYPTSRTSAASQNEPQSQDVSPQTGSMRSQQETSPPHCNDPLPPQQIAPQSTSPQFVTPEPSLQSGPVQNGSSQPGPIQNGSLQTGYLQDAEIQDPVRQISPTPQNSQHEDALYVQNPRLYDMSSGQTHPVDARVQMQPPSQMQSSAQMQLPEQLRNQDPRVQAQLATPPPRNEYERHQQMMMRQHNSMDLRFQPQNVAQPFRHEEKTSSLHKLSSVFKSFGKSQSHTGPTPNPPPPNVPQISVPPNQPQPHSQSQSQPSPQSQPLPPPSASRNHSHHSGLGDLPTDQLAARGQQRLSGVGAPGNRPQSMGTESHISHVSQESTHVQAADSRLDLRYPTSPAPFHGIPPLHPPPGAPPRPVAAAAARASTSGVPETGKKKRFSSLGGLFGRSSPANTVGPVKTKLSKEEKKAQKSQKHVTAPPMRPPPFQQWPIQQQQQRVYGTQYGTQHLPPGAARQYPDMTVQGVAPQNVMMQGRLPQGVLPQGYIPQSMQPQQYPPQSMQPQGIQSQPMPPPGMQFQGYPSQSMPPQSYLPRSIPPQALPQSYMSPQDVRQQPLPPQQAVSESSAYQDTRQLAQLHHSGQVDQVSRSNGPSPQPSISAQSTNGPPPDGYYKPDTMKSSSQTSASPSGTPVPQQSVQQPLKTQIQLQAQPNLQLQPQSQPMAPPHLQQQQSHSISPPEPDIRRFASAATGQPTSVIPPVQQRHVSSPDIFHANEPQYETPQIPAAYNHVHGAYVSPSLQQPLQNTHEPRPSPGPYGSASGRQYSDPHMQTISPQISAQSQFIPGQRQDSDSSVVSAISPVPNNSLGLTNGAPSVNQRPPKARMSSISEATQHEKPWNLDLRAGATEQEIVRARQRQYMEQQIAHNQQVNAERIAKSPSPQPSHHTQSPSPHPPPAASPQPQQQGFREVLPRAAPQQYHAVPSQPPQSHSPVYHEQGERQRSPRPEQPRPVYPTPTRFSQTVQPAAYPLPTSPAPATPRSPINPLAHNLPSHPQHPHTPMQSAFPIDVAHAPHPHQQSDHPPPFHQSDYDQQPPDEPPPSYDGPGLPHDGMEKEGPRPANMITAAPGRGRQREREDEREPRQRQLSIALNLQHPTPATMAASPQRSPADMGADILRQQLLENAERTRREQLNRAEMQRQETQREREERDRARARARELERSVSGGGRVSSLSSAQGSQRGYRDTNASGVAQWSRGSTTRPVFELPAEDDEPVMRATSFPGQEWVPTWTED